MSHLKFNIFINPKSISVNDRGFNYGDGLFETILVKDSKIKYLKEHIDRLHSGCIKLKIQKPKLTFIRQCIKTAIGENKDGVIKIILSRGSSPFGYKFPKDIKHNLYIMMNKKILSPQKKISLKLKFSKHQIYENPLLAKIKHLNRIDQCLVAYNFNQLKNINDLIVLNSTNIIETMSSNIFFVQKIKSEYIFYTPKIDKIGVDGIMKNQVIKHLKKNNYRIIEKNISSIGLKKYCTSFIVNSIQGLVFVNQIENNKFSNDEIIYNILSKFIY